MQININKNDVVHFVGIGGIGMSGIALIMKSLGYAVQGSDLSKSKNTERLKKKKIKIFHNHSYSNVKKAKIIVISSAITNKNKELLFAKKKNILIIKRADMLAHLLSLKKNIIISGSHGKTTITSLVSTILNNSKYNPTIVNGGILNSINANARVGKDDWAVVEADESDGSFLKFKKLYSITSNIDYEHMDYYKNIKNLYQKFEKFINTTTLLGKAIVCSDDKKLKKIAEKNLNKNILTYGYNSKADFRILNSQNTNMGMKFDLKLQQKKKKITLNNFYINLIGKHNVLNATASIALALSIGINQKVIKHSLKEFKGVQRRMTQLMNFNNKLFYDDYAHHPTEITAVLKACRANFSKRKIISVFQPHRYSRLKYLYDKFTKSFYNSDVVLLCPIYSAGEKKNNISQYKLGRDIIKNSKTEVILVNNEVEIEKFLKKNLANNEIVIGMGAGSISMWMKKISINYKKYATKNKK